MRTKAFFAVAVMFAMTPWLIPWSARAQPVTTHIFEGISISNPADPRSIRISFSIPIRYLSHAPLARGRSITVQFQSLESTRSDAAVFFRRETLQIPRDLSAVIEEVVYQGLVAGRPMLEVRLTKSMRFEVHQGENLRSVVIVFPAAAAPILRSSGGASQTPRAISDRSGGRASDPRGAERIREGRRAMTAGEYDRAVHIFTKVASRSDDTDAEVAQELLGLARERLGQLAHAKAEYETYLERHPDGTGADRVRQRLDALVTARPEKPDTPAPRQADPVEQQRLDFESFGSIYAGYRRQSLFLRGDPELLTDSSFFTDLHVETRVRTDNYSLRTQMTGGYRREFLAGGSDETRTNSLFIEAQDHPRGLLGSLGRRSLSTAGILGRFDGLRLEFDVGERWTLGTTAGFPVDSATDNSIQTHVTFAGINLDVAKLLETVDAQIYAIGQWDGRLTDRVAVGTELRYFDSGRFAAIFVDYDLYFTELNLAQFVGNWQVTPSTLLTAFLDHRLVPTLTTRNALQGQQADGLAEMLERLSEADLKDLARDRTARTTTISLGVNRSLSDQLQLSADFSAVDYSGTRGSAGVDAIEGVGFDFSYSTNLIWNDFLKPAGLGIAGLRFFDGSENDLLTATLDGRYPI
ncbi:MAG: tol-pal system YbgF family protein, partial [Dehalococcoidia bacterium]